jgi:hypothetical protein
MPQMTVKLSPSRDSLAATQAVLPISLIATERAALITCCASDDVGEIVTRFAEYDHIPVTEDGRPESRVLGLLNTHCFRDDKHNGQVGDAFEQLREEHLIGADAPIIEFIWEVPERDCRLLVAGKKISGLVTVSDLQALPVRAALFALVTRLEIVMSERIKTEFRAGDGWIECLPPARQELLRQQIEAAKEGEAYVESLLCTQFADKVTILAKSGNLPESRTKFERDLRDSQKLRDAVAHANEYASTRAKALQVCETVRSVSKWIEHLSS